MKNGRFERKIIVKQFHTRKYIISFLLKDPKPFKPTVLPSYFTDYLICILKMYLSTHPYVNLRYRMLVPRENAIFRVSLFIYLDKTEYDE